MRILRSKEVIEITGLSRVTIWRKEKDGTFPKRVNLGENSVGWIDEEIYKWIKSLPRGSSNNNGGSQ